ncbi:MAG TPA: MXAN_5187 C-terminal domain-containing protein [Terriglobales bacterium]|nr:MXAN_5187 C-terminal domain-containing protein [Terriglobales bacterium]
MTVDEELSLLDESVRRLKIEYDVYFGGGSKKPPDDTDWRVKTLIKKYSDGSKMSFAQRFRYNSIVQRYALFSDLWRQKLKIKEEGYRRPQDAALGISGMRQEEAHQAEAALKGEADGVERPFIAHFSDPDAEHDRVQQLYEAMIAAKQKVGEAPPAGDINSFKQFVKKKTEQLRKDYGCHAVEYSVEMENGQVKLKAKAKV